MFFKVFPDNYHGSPNVTVTPEGRRYFPEKRHNNNLVIPDPGLREGSWASEATPSLSGPPSGESSVMSKFHKKTKLRRQSYFSVKLT